MILRCDANPKPDGIFGKGTGPRFSFLQERELVHMELLLQSVRDDRSDLHFRQWETDQDRAKVISRGHYVAFRMAEVPSAVFALIAELEFSPWQRGWNMTVQLCGLEAEKAVHSPFEALAVCVSKAMPEGPLGTFLLCVLVLFVAAAPFVFKRYVGLVGQGSQPEGSLERQDYDKLRASLAGDNRVTRLYAQWLIKFLDWIERAFGDVGMAGRTLFPHIFWLTKPAPLWTAPALDRCLLLAVIYPVATIFLIWMLSGQVGPAETALGLRADLPEWRRILGVAAYAASSFAMWRFSITTGRRRVVLGFIGFLGPFVGLAALGFNNPAASVVVNFFIWSIPSVLAIRLPSALTIHDICNSAWTRPPSLGVFSAATVCLLAVGPLVVEASPGVLAFACVFAVVVMLSAASKYKSLGFFLAFFPVMIVACLMAANLAALPNYWPSHGPFLLFLGLLTLLNSPFVWASLGLTRALLRRGLELEGWWPYGLALVDACLATVIVALLALVMVLGVQAFDELAVHAGGESAAVMSLDTLFDEIAKNPAAPKNWWAYALLLSSMIPSLVNLAIGGVALVRGIPWLAWLLLQSIPPDRAVPEYNRQLAAMGLTAQMFAGVLLGVAAFVFLVWGVIGHLMPGMGFNLLAMARAVAEFDLPGRIGTLFAGTA
jgi:hypothetical protein